MNVLHSCVCMRESERITLPTPLFSAQKSGRIVLDTPSEARRRMNSDETVLGGRAASTPQGSQSKLDIM